jgi:hypothetical protein
MRVGVIAVVLTFAMGCKKAEEAKPPAAAPVQPVSAAPKEPAAEPTPPAEPAPPTPAIPDAPAAPQETYKSCDWIASMSGCDEATDDTDQEEFRFDCKNNDGKLGKEPCPAKKKNGVCKWLSPLTKRHYVRYFYAIKGKDADLVDYSKPDQAKHFCEQQITIANEHPGKFTKL